MASLSRFNMEMESRICEKLAEGGMTLRQVAEAEGISHSLILYWVGKNKAFADQYARAMELRTEIDFEGLADIINQEPERGKSGVDLGWVAWQRLRVDTMKWSLSKRNPKKYGERVGVDKGGSAGLILVTDIPRPNVIEAERDDTRRRTDDRSVVDTNRMD